MKKTLNSIFQRGSTTYYYSSLFFPKDLREKIFSLYAFVRVADDFVDSVPQQTKAFQIFVHQTKHALSGKTSGNGIVDQFAKLVFQEHIPHEWIFAFLDAMRKDLTVKTYNTFSDLEKYMYGSANVIGLMLAKIMKLSPESFTTAELQGEAMQFVNFIRDIKEDISLGRTYIPQEDLQQFHLQSFDMKSPGDQEFQSNFSKLIRFELERFYTIQRKAEEGYAFIPKKYLLPIKTAAAMYIWTAEKIYENPMIVFEKKIKPSKWRVYATYTKLLFTSL
jgi:phytoene synthase